MKRKFFSQQQIARDRHYLDVCNSVIKRDGRNAVATIFNGGDETFPHIKDIPLIPKVTKVKPITRGRGRRYAEECIHFTGNVLA